jgi:hypothetical protein
MKKDHRGAKKCFCALLRRPAGQYTNAKRPESLGPES